MKASSFELAVGRLEEEVKQSHPLDLPAVIGELERMKAVAQMKLLGTAMNGSAASGDEWLLVEEAAAHVKVSKDRIYKLCRMPGGIPHHAVGKNLRILKSELDAWWKAGGHDVLTRGKA